MMMTMKIMTNFLLSFLTGLLGSAQALWGAQNVREKISGTPSRLRRKDALAAIINLLSRSITVIQPSGTGRLGPSARRRTAPSSFEGPVSSQHRSTALCPVLVSGACKVWLAYSSRMAVSDSSVRLVAPMPAYRPEGLRGLSFIMGFHCCV